MPIARRANDSQIGAIVVNFRKGLSASDLAMRTYKHLAGLGHEPRVVIVDNSGEVVEGDNYSVIRLPNPGYAAAVNRGLESLPACKYIFILTHEVEAPARVYARLLEAMQEDSDLAACGPLLEWPDGRELSAGKRLTWRDCKTLSWAQALRGASSDGIFCVDAVDGAAWVIDRNAYLRVGPLDETFFLYWEEIDWFYRAGRLGLRVGVCINAIACAEPNPDIAAAGHQARNRILFFSKHAGRPCATLIGMASLARMLIYWLAARILQRTPFADRAGRAIEGTIVGLRDCWSR